VLARRLEIASIRAAAIPPAAALVVSDTTGRVELVGDASTLSSTEPPW
jgi:hypothetical protein